MCGARRGRGYSLVALVVAMTVMLILIAAALPLWSRVVQRDREEELIFRGRQYVEAIRLFQKRNGRLPMKLEELVKVKPRCVRQLWDDPITRSADWGLLYFGQGVPVPGQGQGIPGLPPPKPSPSPSPTLGPPGSGQPGQPGVGTLPIVGVHSKSPKKSLRVYKGRQRYNEWHFTLQDLIQGPGRIGPPQPPVRPPGGGPGGEGK